MLAVRDWKKNKSTAVVTFIRGFNFLRILFRLIEISQCPWWPLYCWSYVKGRKIEAHMYHSWAGQYSCSRGQWISYPHYCFMECRDFRNSTKFTHKGHFIHHKVVLALLEYLYNVLCAAEFKAENKIKMMLSGQTEDVEFQVCMKVPDQYKIIHKCTNTCIVCTKSNNGNTLRRPILS